MPDRDFVFADHHWETRAGGKVLLYLGPHINATIEPREIRTYASKRGAWGAVWNYGWDRHDGPWYAFVCDTPEYELDKIESKNSRKTIRRSLERCSVKRVEPAWLAEHGYECYHNATERYTNFKVWSQAEFSAEMSALTHVPGVIMHGVFVEGALAAYGIAYDVGGAARFREAFFDPAYSQAKPMYALYYVLAHELLNAGYNHIDAGWRPFVHDTNIEEFFRRMGWHHAPCHVGVYLNARLRTILGVARRARPLVSAVLPPKLRLGLQALLVAQDVAGQSAS